MPQKIKTVPLGVANVGYKLGDLFCNLQRFHVLRFVKMESITNDYLRQTSINVREVKGTLNVDIFLAHFCWNQDARDLVVYFVHVQP